MKIDIAVNDLQTLRAETWYRLQWLRNTPAGKSSHPMSYAVVANQIAVLEKFIRKLNRALTVVHGHDCNADFYK